MDANEAYLLGALKDAHVDFKRGEIQVFQKNLEWLYLIDDILFELFGLRGTISKRDVFQLRKKNKKMVARIEQLLQESLCNEHFVAGLFDAEGCVKLSSKSKIPVLDITQCDRGRENLEAAKEVFEKHGIKCYLNGPYAHVRAKRPQYHLCVYGVENCKKFVNVIPIKHPEKRQRLVDFGLWNLRL